MELIGLGSSVISLLSRATFLRCLIIPLSSLTVIDSPVLLHLSFIIYSTLAFTPWKNSNYVVVSVSIYFTSYSKWDPSFHRTCYDFRLRWTLWSFKRCTIVGYPYPRCFGCCCCCWILRMGPDWNWCIYPSS